MDRPLRVNRQIRIKEVRLIGPDGKQLGIMPTFKAFELAQAAGLDLVEVAPHERPPVCKIMDFGKYKYQERKRRQQALKKQRAMELKEIWVLSTGDHDYKFKLDHIKKFLEKGHKVKVTVRSKHHPRVRAEIAREVLDKVIADTEDIAKVESPPRVESRMMSVTLMPKG